MADGDGAAERVHHRGVEVGPLAEAGQRLGRERLVELEGGQVAEAGPALASAGGPPRRGRCRRGAARRRDAAWRRSGPAARARSPQAVLVGQQRAAAPSLSGEELPAVTVPPARKPARSLASDSCVTPSRIPSSRARSNARHRHHLGVVRAAFQAAPPVRGCGPRTRLRFAGDAELVGEQLGGLAERAPSTPAASGLTIRQPSVVENISATAGGKGRSGLGST